MAFASDLVLNDGAATPVARTFALQNYSPGQSTRIDTISAGALKRLLSMRYPDPLPASKTRPAALDVHQFQFSLENPDANADGVSDAVPVIADATFTLRKSSVVTRLDCDHLIAFTINLLTVVANRDRFLRKEV